MKVPHGLENVQLDISTNEHASARHRIGKDGPLIAGRTVKLGTLDHDVKGIEIVRYVAPIIVINATTKDGQQVKGFKATVEYTDARPGLRQERPRRGRRKNRRPSRMSRTTDATARPSSCPTAR